MPDAPRLHCWWQHVAGTSILQMDRRDWQSLVGCLGEPVELQVTATPLAGVAAKSAIVASVARQIDTATARVTIVRYDKVDEPTPFNLDEYDVWTDLARHPKLPAMINAASTTDNANLRAFCSEYVFFVKRAPGPDHWLSEIPADIMAVIEKA